MTFSFSSKLDSLGYNLDAFEEETVELCRQAVAGLAKAAQAEWIRLAQVRLSTSREMYINGLRQAESFAVEKVGGENVYTISLIGEMPNAIESGMPSFDMKASRPGWLGGSKAKVGKDGKKYVTVPFRHSTGSTARLDYSGKAAAMDLKKELKKTVRAYGLDRMKRASTGAVIPGAVKRVPKDPDVHRYLHGLTKIQKPMAGFTKSGMQRGSSQLMTWRRISENSPSDAWIHPGFQARNLLREVQLWVESESEVIIERILAA